MRRTAFEGRRSRVRKSGSWPFAVLGLATALAVPGMVEAQGPGVEGGKWTYLGGDAWHTRYTPADQINASNFQDLQVVWEWDARSFGPSTARANG